jgi:hypothetical protein
MLLGDVLNPDELHSWYKKWPAIIDPAHTFSFTVTSAQSFPEVTRIITLIALGRVTK